MTPTLLETWHSAKAAPLASAPLKMRLTDLIEQQSPEIGRALVELKSAGRRDESIELRAVARALSARADLELDAVHQQCQLLMIPVLVAVPRGSTDKQAHFPELSGKYGIDEALASSLGLQPRSIRVGPFPVSVAHMEALPIHDVRPLAMHLATMGDCSSLVPALLEQDAESENLYSLLLPAVWTGLPDAPLPPALASQGMRPGYGPLKMRLEEILETEVAQSTGLAIHCTVFKPLSFAMSFGFIKRFALFVQLRTSARNMGGAEGGSMRWQRTGDRLLVELDNSRTTDRLEFLLPDEKDEGLGELLTQAAAALKVRDVSNSMS